jgi:ABC-type multidrug transport system fused ATPase/permease subunit
MESSIFGFIRRYSWRQQLVILAMTGVSLPFLYLSLDLPKIIINQALSGSGPFEVFGFDLEQLDYLMVLCGFFLGLVLINGGLKYVINVYVGIVAERMLRRLRYQLYSQVMRFPLPHLRRVSQGELVQMINAEVEPLGGFVGDACAVPAFQGGTLLTILAFMFVQDWILGLAAIALYPLQIWLIPKLQKQVNELGKQRVRQVRRNAERISEMAGSVRDIRANDTSWWERARWSDELYRVFIIRFEIYKKKFLIKFINNFLAQFGPFLFFSIGGWLVLEGQITIGALVAVIGAQKEMASPWRELLTYYQNLYDVKIKYEQTVTQFVLPGLREPKLMDEQPAGIPRLEGELRASALVLKDENDEPILDGVTFRAALPTTIAITGPAGSGKEALTLILAGLLAPHAGRVTIGAHDLANLPDAVLGRRIGYVGNPTSVLSGTIELNLLYGLMHRPLVEPPPEIVASRARARAEAGRSGNAPYDVAAEWVDWQAAGIDGPAARLPALVRVLRLVRLDHDIYAMGLKGAVGENPALEQALLEARRRMHDRLATDARLARLVEPFDRERYNDNATLTENLLFGAPIGPTFEWENLAADPDDRKATEEDRLARRYIRDVLRQTDLIQELGQVGWALAGIMVELFADLPPEHEYFQQFSFVRAEDLPYYRNLLARGDPRHLEALPREDRDRLFTLTFKLIPARHRLGLLTPELQAKVLRARDYFRENLPPELAGAIAFFDPDRYNVASSIQDNVLFGKIAYGQAQAQQRIAEVVASVLDELDLRDRVIEVGLRSECGLGGGRLSAAQRQKLGLARAIFKRPDILILDDATALLDAVDQVPLRDALFEEMRGRTLIWATQQADWIGRFERVLRLDSGKVVEERAPALEWGGDAERQRVATS